MVAGRVGQEGQVWRLNGWRQRLGTHAIALWGGGLLFWLDFVWSHGCGGGVWGILLKHGLLCSFIQKESSLQALRLFQIANLLMGSGIEQGFVSVISYLNYSTSMLMAFLVLVVAWSAGEYLLPISSWSFLLCRCVQMLQPLSIQASFQPLHFEPSVCLKWTQTLQVHLGQSFQIRSDSFFFSCPSHKVKCKTVTCSQLCSEGSQTFWWTWAEFVPNPRTRCILNVFLGPCVVNVTWLWNGVPRANVACDQSTGIREEEEEFFFRKL